MSEPVTIIAGLGRCGSSLLMQMLEAVEYPVTGPYPSFEDERAMFDPDWLMLQGGKAVKILTPNCPDIKIPKELTARIIWLDRNRKEQSKSTGKFLTMMCGIPVTRDDIKRLAANAKEERRVSMAKLSANGPILEVWFEALISKDDKTIREICAFLGLPLEYVGRMKSVVLPRSSICADGLDIEISLTEQRAGAG